MSGSILWRVSDIQEQKNKIFLASAPVLTLICDAKTDISKRNVTNWILASATGDSVLYEFSTGTPAKDGESIALELIEMGKRIKATAAETVLNFVSDSASAYVKARRLLEEDSDSPFKFVGPFLSHQSNLILKVSQSVVFTTLSKFVA